LATTFPDEFKGGFAQLDPTIAGKANNVDYAMAYWINRVVHGSHFRAIFGPFSAHFPIVDYDHSSKHRGFGKLPVVWLVFGTSNP
jgi:hypothetical protein